MRQSLAILILLFSFHMLLAQDIPTYKFTDLERKISKESAEKTLVLNFWATWCAPCIKELPYFESLHQEGEDLDVKVLLVSLDMAKDKAEKFVEKKQLQSEVVYLDEVDFNAWINKISPDWSGAIPATLFVKPGGKQMFYEGQFTKEELYDKVKSFSYQND
ncbi:TlpA disulfide reductase family protein [Porifericola rhodea]|uniref:TlpA family protein disulfide reductase n=1 Tax=Porifericola rhodea TaxID=930972 RepID=UPI002667030E|nr:TlpA disulfide reductase family protein [Porifericola rhodea]WKN30741.1 TlpA disulfide reductase family protein [Porifericola rhodea]